MTARKTAICDIDCLSTLELPIACTRQSTVNWPVHRRRTQKAPAFGLRLTSDNFNWRTNWAGYFRQ